MGAREQMSDFCRKNFSDRLRAARENAGFTQQQVADVIHVHRSTYSYYELGVSEPSLAATKELALLFQVSVDDLLGAGEN